MGDKFACLEAQNLVNPTMSLYRACICTYMSSVHLGEGRGAM